jgi:excisionase family DNA binding protein
MSSSAHSTRRGEPMAAGDGGQRQGRNVEPRFYTLEDVATILAVRVAQVYALVRTGDLPAVKLGGRGVWRVDRNQLEAYIERMHEETAVWAREHPPTSQREVTERSAQG